MLFSTLPVLALLGLASTAPTKQQAGCDTLVESSPWKLSHLVRFESSSPRSASHISFDFEDDNKGLELKTQCEHHVPAGVNQTLIEDGTYYPCANSTVRFMFSNATTINIARVHFDPCLGPPGYQTEDAFGYAVLDWESWRNPGGVVSRSQPVEVPIRELVA